MLRKRKEQYSGKKVFSDDEWIYDHDIAAKFNHFIGSDPFLDMWVERIGGKDDSFRRERKASFNLREVEVLEGYEEISHHKMEYTKSKKQWQLVYNLVLYYIQKLRKISK